MDQGSTPSCSSCGSWWRLPLLLALVLAAVYLSRNLATRPVAESEVGGPTAAAPESGKSVSLAIEFGGDRRREFGEIPWRDGMTVGDAMAAAAKSPKPVEFLQRGSGEAAFVTQIEGVENEGAEGRNWTYAVNGKLGDRSFAIYPLSPGDQVLWSFAAPQ